MKACRGMNRKGLIALSFKLEKDAKDSRKEFKKWGYYSGSTLTYKETLLVLRAIKYAWLERARQKLFRHELDKRGY
jgi:hypothetical protein